MRPFIVKQLDYDLTPVAGLALVGHHLNRLASVFKRIDSALPVKNGVANSDILRSYLGLLVQGQERLRRDRELPRRCLLQAGAGYQAAALQPDAAPAHGCTRGRPV